MKVQYPGVARSIESDVDNLMRLIRVANILPKGLYVENAGEGCRPRSCVVLVARVGQLCTHTRSHGMACENGTCS